MNAAVKKDLLHFQRLVRRSRSSETKTMLKGLGLKPTASPVATVWNYFNHIDLYDLNATEPRKRATRSHSLPSRKPGARNSRTSGNDKKKNGHGSSSSGARRNISPWKKNASR
jgi:hypothetical protein